MANPATRISIYADDRASAVMRTVARESETLCKRIEDLGKNATKYFIAFQAGFTGVSGIGGFLKDTALAAARYETLGAAMDRAGENVGKNRAEMAAFEAQLVRNGIALNESREILTRLAASNVDLAVSAKLARTAQDLAVVSNTNSSQALNTLVHGIISAQPEMLRTLGLAVNFEGAYAKAAQSMGKSAAGLTEAEKLQARMNAALEAGTRYAGIYETTMQYAGKQLGSFTRHWENLKTLAGGFALDTLSMSIFGVNESLSGLNDSLMDMKASGEMAEYSKNIAEAMRGLAGSIDEVLVMGVAWRASYAVLNTASAQRIQALVREHGALNTLKASIAGTTSMLGQDTAAYIANTQAAIANSRARLGALDSAISAKQGIIAESLLPVHAADLDAIKTRRTFEKELKGLQAERLIVSRQLEQAETALAAATNRTSAGMRLLGGTMGRLRSLGAGLLGMFGGPLGLAFTAVAGAAWYLSNQESEAAKYARDHADAMQLVSQSADTAQAAMDRYAQKLARMNEQERAYEQANIARSIKDITYSGSAYREIVNGITPWAAFDDNAGEIRKRLSNAAEIVLPSKIVGATVADLQRAKAEVLAIATEFDRTKEAAEALQSLDALISLKMQSEEAGKAVAQIGDSAVEAASKINALANINFDSLLVNVDFEIGKVGLTDRNRAIVDGLIRSKALDQSKIAIQGGSFDISGLTPEAEAQVEKYAAALGRLHDRQQAARSSGKDLQSALASLNDELAKITLTEQEYARYQFERKFAELQKDLKATTPALVQWAAIQQMALGAGYTGGDALASHIRDVAKAIGEIGLDEKEKQIRAVNEEFARLFAYMDAGGTTPFSRDEAEALQSDRIRQAQSGKTDKQLQVEFEKEFLNVMRGSEAEQLASIAERAAAYREAGADAVRVSQWQKEMELQYSRDATAGIKRGLKSYADDATNMGKQIEGAMLNSFGAMEDSLVNFVRTGKLEFSDLANSIVSDLARIMIRTSITGPLAKMGQDFIGSFFSAHTGGVVGMSGMSRMYAPAAIFAGAPRYHSGGPILAPGEVPIIAQVGERVLTREESAAYARGPAPVDLTVSLKNESGQPLQAKSQQTQWSGDMRSAVVTIVLDAVNRNYMGARDALRG